MVKRTIIFRADGNYNIGMGHFIRTLALAEMLNTEYHCIYALQKPTDFQKGRIEKTCHGIIELPNDNCHFNTFLNIISGSEIVVLDNYYFSTDYQRSIKAKGCKLVCIDDMYDKHYVADVVINHTVGIMKNAFSKETYTKLYLGLQYALLRKEFLCETNTSIEKKYSCFVMMGGADTLKITDKIRSLIKHESLLLPIAIIIGPAFQDEAQLKEISNACVFKNISAKKIFQLMVNSKFGILPASTVAIEACAARIPFICGYYADNQKVFYKELKKNKIAVCIDDFSQINRNTLHKAIQLVNQPQIVNDITNRQKILLDKKSKERIIAIFNEL